MDILRFKQFEKKLSISELSEPAPSNFNGNGNKRGDVLIKKVEDGDPLIIGPVGNRKSVIVDEIRDPEGVVLDNLDGMDGVKDNEDRYDPSLATNFFKNGRGHYINTFIGQQADGTDCEFTLNNIEKTTDFGSSGPGRNIDKCEVIQAIFIHLNRVNPQIALSVKNAVQIFQQFVLDTPNLTDFIKTNMEITPDMINDLDSDWLYTFSEIPGEIEHLLRDHKKSQYVIIHNKYNRPSPYRSIKNKVKQFLPGTEISKFYPGDLIVVSDHRLVIDVVNGNRNGGFGYLMGKIEATQNINELISLLNNLFNEKVMCSLSLKKLKAGLDYSVIINNDSIIGNNIPDPVNFEFNGFEISRVPERGRSSKVSTISRYRGVPRYRIMIFRGDKGGDLNGEVEGSTSRHGKISLQIINKIIRRHFQDFGLQTQDFEFVRRRVVLNDLNNNQLLNQINSLIGDVAELVNHGFNIDRNLSGRDDISNNRDGLISKLQSLEMIKLLADISMENNECFDLIINDIFKYAMSIQVWHDQNTPPNRQGNLLTPKYFRTV